MNNVPKYLPSYIAKDNSKLEMGSQPQNEIVFPKEGLINYTLHTSRVAEGAAVSISLL